MTGPNRLAYAALVAVCIIWGTTYLVIRVAVQSIPPSLMGGFRWIIAGTLLLLFVRLRGEALPRPHEWRSLAIQGLLMIGFGNGFVNWAEQYVPSGLAAVVIATCPFFMTGVEALRSDGERIARRALTGLGLGFAGILVLVWPDLHLDGGNGMSFVLGLLALQGACLGWALGSSYSKRHPHGESVIGATGLQMVFGGLVLMLAGTIAGEWQRLAWDSRGVEAMTYLIVVGSIGGFVSYIYALRYLPVSAVSIYAYINPLIAVILGALLLDEQFGIRTLVSMAIVFAGVSLVKAKPTPATSERAPMSHAGARRATTAG
jgi:drug/metabolite transporter (DMT)-like permease